MSKQYLIKRKNKGNPDPKNANSVIWQFNLIGDLLIIFAQHSQYSKSLSYNKSPSNSIPTETAFYFNTLYVNNLIDL